MCAAADPAPGGISALSCAPARTGYDIDLQVLAGFLEDRGLVTWILAGRHLPSSPLSGQIWTHGGLLKSPRSPCASQALWLIKLHTPHSSAVFE
ncbi:Gm9903 [Phodopus roborovskii]|uniref:Gm9903 protein n=1 Tax=Phodopus roborovskii TaxID=109678 RepID=A0AAU9ZZ99_PHORO|nr:Gm9903 [Phodopus roborovskii]